MRTSSSFSCIILTWKLFYYCDCIKNMAEASMHFTSAKGMVPLIRSVISCWTICKDHSNIFYPFNFFVMTLSSFNAWFCSSSSNLDMASTFFNKTFSIYYSPSPIYFYSYEIFSLDHFSLKVYH